jgi:DNA helicase HerA-like ATPase
MTGSGKTGLLTVLIEESLRSKVPVLVFDVKGDLPNLLFRFPRGNPRFFLPWIDTDAPEYEGHSVEEIANRLYQDREADLDLSGIFPDAV